MKNKLSVVVPAYNEENTIATILQQVLKLKEVSEVIVVNDCSSDSTAEILAKVKNKKLRVLNKEVNQGKTAAVKDGLALVTGDIVIIQDADLEYDPEEIPLVVEPILNGRADVVYGSRFLVRKAARVLYYYHYLANKFLTFLSNLLTNINFTDIETCYKCFRTDIIREIPLTSKGFGMEVEITAMMARLPVRIFEVPISYYGRTYEEGKKIGMTDGIAAIWYILHYNIIAPRRAKHKNYLKSVRDIYGS